MRTFRFVRRLALLAAVPVMAALLSGCGGPGPQFTILSGSENDVLEPLVQEFCKSRNATCTMRYQGSLDIALALVLEPKVLLLDEPTAGMGTEERWRMIDKVRELWEKQKITVVFIEHDMDIVFKIAPQIVVLCYGRILATGTPDAIRSNEAVIEAYLGSDDLAGAVA